MLDKNIYRNQFQFIEYLYLRDRNAKSIQKIISESAIATHTPVIVVAEFIKEIRALTSDQEMDNIINNLCIYYGYHKG